MIDKSQFSSALLASPQGRNDAALERIALAKRRVLSILDRETVAHQRTLEQKISDQGPRPQRVDPHLVGLALMDMLFLNRVRHHVHAPSKTKGWYSNIGTPYPRVDERLETLGPLYASITRGGFGNQVGDALEVVTFKALKGIAARSPRFAYQGHFLLDQPKKGDRYLKNQPPKSIGGGTTIKEADFIQYGHNAGPLCIECKNYREWLYPHSGMIKELIIKSHELNAVPVMIHRRIHYTTMTNFFTAAGIISHEALLQYYPAAQAELAARVKHARSLGFTDVTASEDPTARTLKFFEQDLPAVVPHMAERWQRNREALYDYALERMNLAQLYNAIGSRAAGKWRERGQELEEEDPEPIDLN